MLTKPLLFSKCKFLGAFKKEKALEGTFSRHYVILRRFVGRQLYYPGAAPLCEEVRLRGV